jgi:hypothetical protein
LPVAGGQEAVRGVDERFGKVVFGIAAEAGLFPLGSVDVPGRHLAARPPENDRAVRGAQDCIDGSRHGLVDQVLKLGHP